MRWRVDGKWREPSFHLRKDAEAWKRKVESEEVAGVAIDPRAGDERFGRYADNCLDTRLVKGRPLSPMTVEGYWGPLHGLGIRRFRKISVERSVSGTPRYMQNVGIDAAAKSHRLIRAIMNSAAHDERIGRNPGRIPGGDAEHAPERPMIDTKRSLSCRCH